MVEFCHNVAPVMQPSPNRNPGGDCFACALTAAMGYCFPDRPPMFDQVWEWFRCCYYGETEKRALNNTWGGMQKAVANAREDGYALEVATDRVMPQLYRGLEIWGMHWPLEIDAGEYCRRLEAYLSAGWVALTEILYAGTGPFTPDGLRRSTDHFVAIDGVRGREVRIVCSARGAYWIDADEMLRRHGGAAWILVRKER